MILDDPYFDAQWLRTAGHSGAGGAELGECLSVAGAIRGSDIEGWYAAWLAMGERVLARADESRAAGRDVSARGAYLRASNYLRTAYAFLMGPGADPRIASTYRQHRQAFGNAAALMQPAAERITIPYDGGALNGYLFCASSDGARRPTLIINGGYDSTAEELYLFSGAAAVARGYTCIVFDRPGQGDAIIERGIVFRPDWEAVVTPVVDAAARRPEVDPKRIALMGLSFGGYLAPRAASAERRLAACIADPGEYSLREELESRLPAFVARQLDDGGSRPIVWLLDRVLQRRLRQPTAGWVLRRGLWVHGVETPLELVRLMGDYTLEGRAERIACPTLVCSAERDEIGVTARRLFDALSCQKEFATFTAAEGAGAHCESGARAVFNQRALDWLDGVLGVASPAVG